MKTISTPTVRLITCTPEPRKVVAIAARMTSSARDVNTLTEEITEEEIKSSVNAILERRHFSCLRHVVYTFSVSGVSRALSHQLVRHTVGHSFEQRSQHYRTEKDPRFIEPISLQSNRVTFDYSAKEDYESALLQAENTYQRLIEDGIPKEDARFILPTACETEIIWTANLEAIYNFVKTRACRVNTSEIMDVAIQVRNLVIADFPEMKSFLGPTCFTQGMCFEGQKFFKVCNLPWHSPTVLWTKNFPDTIELIGVGGKKKILEGKETDINEA